MKASLMAFIIFFSIALFSQDEQQCTTDPDEAYFIARKGCCSHHGGVCGCEGGRAKCCDGVLSPTCGCD